jgi:hypothetical protein
MVINLSNGHTLFGYPAASGLNGTDMAWCPDNGSTFESYQAAVAAVGGSAVGVLGASRAEFAWTSTPAAPQYAPAKYSVVINGPGFNFRENVISRTTAFYSACTAATPTRCTSPRWTRTAKRSARPATSPSSPRTNPRQGKTPLRAPRPCRRDPGPGRRPASA